jgi:hypothetical protein
MKEITECIGDIRWANSTIFWHLTSLLDFGKWKWQMNHSTKQLSPFLARAICMGHFTNVTPGMPCQLSATHKVCSAKCKKCAGGLHWWSFGARGKSWGSSYSVGKCFWITPPKSLKSQPQKCVFGNQEVSYLGFTLMPKGITPGQNKLQSIRDVQPPTTIKMVWSFVGLYNCFRTHIKDFAIITAPLFKVTRKDSGYKLGSLLPDAMHAFKILQQQLMSDPVMAFPQTDRQYALITHAATGTADSPWGLGAILTKKYAQGDHYAISFASRQLKDHEKNYSSFLLEAAAAVCA